MTRRRRTGPTLSLFLIGLVIVPAGALVGAFVEADALATALPSAGLALMTCAAALVATGRTPAMAEVRGLAWAFLVVTALYPLVGSAVTPALLADPLTVGVVLAVGLSVTVTLLVAPAPPRRDGRPFTGGFGMVLTGGVVLLALTGLLVVLAGAVSVLWVPAALVGTAAAAFVAAPAALLVARRVEAPRVVRWLAAAYLAAVYLAPFVIARLLARQHVDGLAIWLLNLLLVLAVLFVATVAVAALGYDAAQRRRRRSSVTEVSQ